MGHYSIQAAARISGISDACIRAWEKRYKSIVPERNKSNHRLYSDQDIERLTLFNKLTSNGIRISQLSQLDTKELKEIYFSVTKKHFDEVQTEVKRPAATFYQSLFIIEESFKARSFEVAYHELGKVIELSDLKDLALKFLPALEGICQSWKDKKCIDEEQIDAFERYTQNIAGQRAHRERQSLREVKTITVSLESNKNRIADASLELLLIAHRLNDSHFSNEVKTDFVTSLAKVMKPNLIFLVGEHNSPELTGVISKLKENPNQKVIVFDQKLPLRKSKPENSTTSNHLYNSIFEIDQLLEQAL